MENHPIWFDSCKVIYTVSPSGAIFTPSGSAKLPFSPVWVIFICLTKEALPSPGLIS